MKPVRGMFDWQTPVFAAGAFTPWLRTFGTGLPPNSVMLIVPTDPRAIEEIEIADDPGGPPVMRAMNLTPSFFPVEIDPAEFGPNFDFRFRLRPGPAGSPGTSFRTRVIPKGQPLVPP